MEVSVEPGEEAAESGSESDREDAEQGEVDVFDLPEGLDYGQQQDVESESEYAGEEESEGGAGCEDEKLFGYVLGGCSHGVRIGACGRSLCLFVS